MQRPRPVAAILPPAFVLAASPSLAAPQIGPELLLTHVPGAASLAVEVAIDDAIVGVLNQPSLKGKIKLCEGRLYAGRPRTRIRVNSHRHFVLLRFRDSLIARVSEDYLCHRCSQRASLYRAFFSSLERRPFQVPSEVGAEAWVRLQQTQGRSH